MERGWDFKENAGCGVLVNDESIKLGQLFFSLRGAKVLLHDADLDSLPLPHGLSDDRVEGQWLPFGR